MQQLQRPSRVARSKFLDRIKGDHIDSAKENFNLNDIRESSYKLPRSRSLRKDHSLERKPPIKTPLSLQNTTSLFQPATPSHCHTPAPSHSHTLATEEQILSLVKTMWECASQLRETFNFRHQMGGIEDILKGIIMGLARPKLSWLTEEGRAGRDSAEEGIEFRKIMYILEDRQKGTQNAEQPTAKKYAAEERKDKDMQEGREQKEQQCNLSDSLSMSFKPSVENTDSLSDITNQFTNYAEPTNPSPPSIPCSYESSFNQYPTSDPTGRTIYELEKLAHSRSNDRIFLKNIVKKTKPKSQYCDHDGSQTISHTNSQSDFTYDRIPKAETLETLEDESQSKRAVLNQIVGMLNRKYNKNIQLQPRKN